MISICKRSDTSTRPESEGKAEPFCFEMILACAAWSANGKIPTHYVRRRQEQRDSVTFAAAEGVGKGPESAAPSSQPSSEQIQLPCHHIALDVPSDL